MAWLKGFTAGVVVGKVVMKRYFKRSEDKEMIFFRVKLYNRTNDILSVITYNPERYSYINVGDWIMATGSFFMYPGEKEPFLTVVAWHIAKIMADKLPKRPKEEVIDLEDIFTLEGGEESENSDIPGDNTANGNSSGSSPENDSD